MVPHVQDVVMGKTVAPSQAHLVQTALVLNSPEDAQHRLSPSQLSTSMLLSPSVAIVTLAFVATVQAEECATSELMTIASNPHLAGCTSALGFGGFSTITALTDEQIQKVCETPACLALMDDMRSMGFGDCTIQGTNISLESDMLDPFAKQCSGSGSVDLSSSTISDEAVVGATSGSSGATMLPLSCIGTLSIALVTLLL